MRVRVRVCDSLSHIPTPHHPHTNLNANTTQTTNTKHQQGTQFQLHMQSLEVPVHASRLVALLKKPAAGAGGAGGLLLGEVKQEKPRCEACTYCIVSRMYVCAVLGWGVWGALTGGLCMYRPHC